MEHFISCFLFSCIIGGVRSFLLDGSILPRAVITQKEYTAAVYNHQAISPPSVRTRQQAVAAMMKNLDIYEKQATIAEKRNVDILVFPEDGIYGAAFSRQSIFPFLENVPNPKLFKWNPCTEPNRVEDSEVQQRLSCMARNHSMYIVANLGAKVNCSGISCPPDHRFQYNTDVVFDPKGALISRYHKRNLFFESQFNYAPVEYQTFDTPFGRFATFTCFDSLFHDPAVTVIERYNVDSVAFPTLWSETPPLLSAFQWQAAFAVGMKVNLLAANHRTAGGSGIYSPTGPVVYRTNYKPAELLVATIPSRAKSFSSENKTVEISAPTSSAKQFVNRVFGDLYHFVPLSSNNGTATVCHGSHCCQVSYSKTDGEEQYVLGAFSGEHYTIARAGVQVCVVMKCVSSSRSSCGGTPLHSSTKFSRFTLTGTFSTKYVFPEILVRSADEPVLPNKNEWRYADRTLDSPNGFSKPLLSAFLFGRRYNLDG